jgi:hypothetical protein
MLFSHNSGLQHHLQLQNTSKVAASFEELNVCKISVNWDISLKRHTGPQCVRNANNLGV